MRLLLVFLFSSQLILEITLEDLDFIRSLSDDKNSIIQNGIDVCNRYFEKINIQVTQGNIKIFICVNFQIKGIDFIFTCSLLKIKVIYL